MVVEFGKKPTANKVSAQEPSDELCQANQLISQVLNSMTAFPANCDLLDYLSTNSSSAEIKNHFDSFLKQLELLAKHWGLLKEEKFKFRSKNVGTHNDSVSQLLPRMSQPYFTLRTLLTSNHKPIGVTKNDEKISKAGREYFLHAAKLQLRFNEVFKLLAAEIAPLQQGGIMSWLTKSPLVVGKELQKKLKTELKHFEICIRIFEQTCIETIVETQQEVLHKNIDIMCVAVDPAAEKKPILNQLLDRSGRLLSQHRQPQEGGAIAEITLVNNRKPLIVNQQKLAPLGTQVSQI